MPIAMVSFLLFLLKNPVGQGFLYGVTDIDTHSSVTHQWEKLLNEGKDSPCVPFSVPKYSLGPMYRGHSILMNLRFFLKTFGFP